jgi:large subunit ribosomal protein L3
MSEENKEVVEATNTKTDLNTIFGVKAGMTRIFSKDGNHVPVTVIKLIPNYISQVKADSYQVAFNEKRQKLVNKSTVGHLKKANIDGFYNSFSEVKSSETTDDKLGTELGYENFSPSTVIDVTGVSKGKGFAGVMKKYNFSGGPGAHGSKFHRTTGSIGNRATPGKVNKGKKMPGHMGSERKTIQNLEVVELNEQKGYMLIKGSVPGSKNSFVRISTAKKQ